MHANLPGRKITCLFLMFPEFPRLSDSPLLLLVRLMLDSHLAFLPKHIPQRLCFIWIVLNSSDSLMSLGHCRLVWGSLLSSGREGTEAPPVCFLGILSGPSTVSHYVSVINNLVGRVSVFLSWRESKGSLHLSRKCTSQMLVLKAPLGKGGEMLLSLHNAENLAGGVKPQQESFLFLFIKAMANKDQGGVKTPVSISNFIFIYFNFFSVANAFVECLGILPSGHSSLVYKMRCAEVYFKSVLGSASRVPPKSEGQEAMGFYLLWWMGT